MKKTYNIFLTLIVFCYFTVFSSVCLANDAKRIIIKILRSHAPIQEITKYIDNRLFNSTLFKDSLSSFAIRINYFLTGTFTSRQVISGKDDWMFYAKESDGNPIGIYEGKDLFSRQEINDAIESLQKVQKKLNEQNIKFSFFSAPNKESIYWDKMPKKYIYSEKNCVDNLLDELKENGVHVLMPKKEIVENKNKYNLYYPHDSHWNSLGSFFAAKSFFEYWNLPFINFNDLNLMQNKKDTYDLELILGLKGIIQLPPPCFDVDYYKKTPVEDISLLQFTNADAQSNNSILIVGDSFRAMLVCHFFNYFEHIYVIHYSELTPELLKQIKVDYVLAEYVERYAIQCKDLYNKMF